MSASKPIEAYALIGDGHTVALVARDGAIDWLCWPRFDSDACLSALLGTEEHGTWRIAPADPATVTRRYAGDDLVLRTEFAVTDGRLVLTDFMPVQRAGTSAIVRRLEALDGPVEVDVLLRLRFGYGEVPLWWEQKDGGLVGEVGPDTVTLRGPGLSLEGEVVRARLTLQAGERADYVLQHFSLPAGTPEPVDPAAAQDETERWWRDWIGTFNKSTNWPEAVRRSLLTLRALTYLPTGGIIAAPTLGLPEKPGGTMNWDYRYCWLRDSTFTLTALLNAGFKTEAEAWQQWLFHAIAGAPDRMRIMYRVDGGRQIEERTLEHLPGWNGARPVRVGNAAAGQRQLDVYGEVLDSARLCQKAGIVRSDKGRATGKRLVEQVERLWEEPDQGMWESRAAPQHYVYSKVMAWVAVDRYLALGDVGGARRGELEALRDRIHADVCAHGYDAGRRSFMQCYGSRHLDASALLLPLVGFLPADDERIAGTFAAIEKCLMEGGFVRRQEAPWLGKEEGVFLPCTCWLADGLAMAGRREEARVLFERVLGISNDLGLLSEEYHVPSGRLVGNFPQALAHIAVVNTGLSLCGPTLQRGGG
ncbi:glycoside hydrolase family 15 protein [Aureimonas leprariae]|uniref:Glycoside hydrolase family 15 protein n=1 Tax=Plantimonas leprariae TaxID=2615207 RepID=A0A7V7PK99_9HYPH|nr:glycoside hydrolase family 15 protein [Aureimonas leprariae]KAB0675607.1 glycoside hydrolase family 15 protein [Aureimonas leprariae]